MVKIALTHNDDDCHPFRHYENLSNKISVKLKFCHLEPMIHVNNMLKTEIEISPEKRASRRIHKK